MGAFTDSRPRDREPVVSYGLIGSADLSLGSGFGLRFTGFVYRLNNVESAMLLVSGTFGGAR